MSGKCLLHALREATIIGPVPTTGDEAAGRSTTNTGENNVQTVYDRKHGMLPGLHESHGISARKEGRGC